MLTMVILFLFISMTIVFGAALPVLKQVRIAKENYLSKQSYFLAKAGMEDVIYRLNTNKQISTPEVLSLNGQSVSTTMVNTSTGKQVVSVGNVNNDVRKIQTNIVFGTGVAFHYGIQVGNGGFDLQNTSTVTGNVFSGGPITGTGNFIYGDVVSSGPTGMIDDIHVTGIAKSHTIQNSTIDKDAYYVVKTNTGVLGVSYPGSADEATIPLPISDDQITEWENYAASGGTITTPCPYKVTTNITLGPKKINCDLDVSGTAVVTLTGPVWVNGNISFANTVKIKVDPSLGSQSIAFIADNGANRTTSSKISIANSTLFVSSGSASSFIFMISQNNSAELNGGETAIDISNSVAGALVAYASHGLIEIANSVALKEVTAYKIRLRNTADVKYDTGLPSALFSSGPGGGYDITDWLEVE